MLGPCNLPVVGVGQSHSSAARRIAEPPARADTARWNRAAKIGDAGLGVLGVKKYANYETITADWICRRLGVVPIKAMR